MSTGYTLEGFENIQYQGLKHLQTLQGRLSTLYKSYGYHQVMTPTLESYDLYSDEEGFRREDLFKLVNHQGKVLVLKHDATVPITRTAAINHRDRKEIIKFFYHTNLYRNFSSPDIIKKEESQMGIEYFGSHSPECDGEIIELALQSLKVNGIQDIHVDIGHVGFINHFFDTLSLSKKTRLELFRLIENKNLADIHDFIAPLSLTKKSKKILMALPMLYGDPKDIVSEMSELCVNEDMEAVVDYLKALLHHTDTVGITPYLYFDLGFTNRMNYYSDLIFKAYMDDWGETVIGGGRYNHLSAQFGIDRPACGFGIDLLGTLDYLDQKGLLEKEAVSTTVILYHRDEKARAHQYATELRSKGKSAEMFDLYTTPKAFIHSQKNNILYENARFIYLKDGVFHHYQNGALVPEKENPSCKSN
ncbi:MAG: ATP phosphoribosyltransferase regulatory subunit [Eubacteriaceae bacterium]|jgi:ATP phosphoribosyltransferase regulatory subunit|nr:ATP phosphoribosyltransferase regulatory subunit [Eubacteriaceae bacterium]